MTAAPQRFYKDVSLIQQDGGYAIALDGRVAKTAGRIPLVAPRALAEAMREEWDSQRETIRLDAMPLTRLQGFVLDAGEGGRGEFTDTIVQYAASDLLCYRACEAELAERQHQAFSVFLDRARCDGLDFRITEGILPVEQPKEALDGVRDRVSALPTRKLFPRKLLTEILGSAILGLYADEDRDNAFAAARLDEAYQAEKWGIDGEAKKREQGLRRDYEDVLRFLSLSS